MHSWNELPLGWTSLTTGLLDFTPERPVRPTTTGSGNKTGSDSRECATLLSLCHREAIIGPRFNLPRHLRPELNMGMKSAHSNRRSGSRLFMNSRPGVCVGGGGGMGACEKESERQRYEVQNLLSAVATTTDADATCARV